jgi:hypothetical protein
MNADISSMWIFVGEGSKFPSGLFSNFDNAAAWIASHELTGILTKYSIDIGVYDWAIATGLFSPETPEQSLPKFVGRFTTAAMDHFHFENGKRDRGA